MKIYVVSVGKNDDYEICGVFTDETKADKLKRDIYNLDTSFWEDVSVEEWDDGEIYPYWLYLINKEVKK